MTMMKRNVMTLYSNDDIYCHQVRIVLAEKGVSVDILKVRDGQINEDLLELNPYNNLPTLVDRELVLYDTQVILEYLEERFPHPPLLPVNRCIAFQRSNYDSTYYIITTISMWCKVWFMLIVHDANA